MVTTNVKDIAGIANAGPAAALPQLACDARELKRVIGQLSEQIADAERRHGEALTLMQQRIGALGSSATQLREQMPQNLTGEMSGVLDRIEGSMAELSERLASQEAQHRAVAAETAPQPVAPALRSAIASDAYSRTARRVHGDHAQPIDPFDVVDSAAAAASEPVLDKDAADALARLYETGLTDCDGVPALDAVTAPLADRANAAGAGDDNQRLDLGAELASAMVEKQAKAFEGQRVWLETRFAEVASRLEQSLSGLKPGGSLEGMEDRFAVLEKKLTEALSGAAKSTDYSSLKSIETQVEDLNAQLVTIQTHFSRLDTIELELRGLAERMSGEEIGKLIEQKAPKSADTDVVASAVKSGMAQQMPKIEQALQSIAAQLSTDRISNLVASAKPAAPDAGLIAKLVAEQVSQRLPSQAGAQTDPTARLDEIQSMLESFIAEQRHGDEQNVTMLDTMQQAMIRLLDRMDAIEQPQHESAEVTGEDVDAYAPAYPQQPAAPNYSAMSHYEDHGRSQSVSAVEETRPTTASYAPELPMQGSARLPEPGSPYIASPNSVSALRASVNHTVPSENEAGASANNNRDDYIAAARRAARMAAEAPAEVPEPAAQVPAKGKRRTDGEGKSGGRKLSAMSMALICLVLVGVSFIAVKSTILAPAQPPRTPSQSSAPAPDANSVERSNAEKRLHNLEDADGDRRRGQAGSNPLPQRSSVQPGPGGADPRDLIGPDNFPPAGNGHQQASAPTLPAALTKDLPASVTPRSNEMPPLSIGPSSLRTAAVKGDPSAEFEIGARFAEGRGVQQDLQQAVNWYQRAASQGFAPAQYRLGSMFERGLGTKVDLARARVWYQRAAEQGIVKAMHNLAVLSAGRDSALTDYQSAGKWFRAAADHGLTDSQFNLAIMYDSGLGMERDVKQAYKWFSLAARAGDEEAAKRREGLRQRLLPQELAEAEAEMAQWRPKPADQNVNDPRMAGETWKSRTR